MNLLTTDDLCPCHMQFFKRYIDPIHKQYQNFKLLAFTTPDWKYTTPKGEEETDNNILTNEKFMRFCTKRKDWLYLGMHGYNHTENFKGFKKDMQPMFDHARKCLDFMADKGASVVNAFKPPFYHWDANAAECARQAGFRWFYITNGVIDLHTFRFYSRSELGLVDSHTNPKKDVNLVDRIDLKPFGFIDDVFEVMR